MPRLVSVIERVALLETEPPVRRARVGVRAGDMASVMSMFPVFVPFSAPMRSVVADIRFSSREVRDSRPTASVPRFITLLLVCGVMVTDPLGAAMFLSAVVVSVMLSTWSKTFPLFEVIELEFTNVPAR